MAADPELGTLRNKSHTRDFGRKNNACSTACVRFPWGEEEGYQQSNHTRLETNVQLQCLVSTKVANRNRHKLGIQCGYSTLQNLYLRPIPGKSPPEGHEC